MRIVEAYDIIKDPNTPDWLKRFWHEIGFIHAVSDPDGIYAKIEQNRKDITDAKNADRAQQGKPEIKRYNIPTKDLLSGVRYRSEVAGTLEEVIKKAVLNSNWKTSEWRNLNLSKITPADILTSPGTQKRAVGIGNHFTQLSNNDQKKLKDAGNTVPQVAREWRDKSVRQNDKKLIIYYFHDLGDSVDGFGEAVYVPGDGNEALYQTPLMHIQYKDNNGKIGIHWPAEGTMSNDHYKQFLEEVIVLEPNPDANSNGTSINAGQQVVLAPEHGIQLDPDENGRLSAISVAKVKAFINARTDIDAAKKSEVLQQLTDYVNSENNPFAVLPGGIIGTAAGHFIPARAGAQFGMSDADIKAATTMIGAHNQKEVRNKLKEPPTIALGKDRKSIKGQFANYWTPADAKTIANNPNAYDAFGYEKLDTGRILKRLAPAKNFKRTLEKHDRLLTNYSVELQRLFNGVFKNMPSQQPAKIHEFTTAMNDYSKAVKVFNDIVEESHKYLERTDSETGEVLDKRITELTDNDVASLERLESDLQVSIADIKDILHDNDDEYIPVTWDTED